MTFGAMAAWQAGLVLAGAAAAAAALFLIKLRPPRVDVPSLLLWRRVLDEARELTLWERIRRAVSLAVTVLIALALGLALTRPGLSAGPATASRGRMLIVLDSSWSMQASTRSGETRWQRAVAEARRLIAAGSGSEIALATTADGLVEGPTADGTLIDAALDRLSPGGSGSLAWPRLAGIGSVHFLTDGALPRPLDSSVIVHSVFEAAPNVAVTAFDVRPSLNSGAAGDAYVEIANYAPSAQKVHVTLDRGAARIFDRELDMGPAEILRQVVPLPRGGDPALAAHVDARANALAVDDRAVAWIDGARPVSVAVVGARIEWLRAALAGDPAIRASFVDPTSYSREGREEDVTIFAGWAPPDPPSRPALMFGPPLNTAWLGTLDEGKVENRPRWEIPGTHPVVQGVDPFTLSIERARSFSSPLLDPVAQSVRGTPLVYVSESPDRRLVVVTFGAEESNLAGAPGFPVLIGNALDWLTHPAARPAQAMPPSIMTFAEGVAEVRDPDGARIPLSRVNRTAVGILRAPGFYVVEGGGARSTLAINAGNPQVSNLTRAPALGEAGARNVEAGMSGGPWWLYCTLAALVLILAEWWTWQRRITV